LRRGAKTVRLQGGATLCPCYSTAAARKLSSLDGRCVGIVRRSRHRTTNEGTAMATDRRPFGYRAGRERHRKPLRAPCSNLWITHTPEFQRSSTPITSMQHCPRAAEPSTLYRGAHSHSCAPTAARGGYTATPAPGAWTHVHWMAASDESPRPRRSSPRHPGQRCWTG
jgi:hypothetical protein